MFSKEGFARWLAEEEKSAATIEKYMRDVREFTRWLGDRELTKETVHAWKEELRAGEKRAETINGMLSAVNAYLRFIGREECKVSHLKVQRTLFRDGKRELSRAEYVRLVEAAKCKSERLALLLQAMASTGVRVSEVKFITVEAARRKLAEVTLKGKSRKIIIPKALAKLLLAYARENGIESGAIFLTRNGTSMSRQQIWNEMKAICEEAGVEKTKVFPHNLRHLFARCLYEKTKDIAGVADVLGHSSVETTRIYLTTTVDVLAKKINQLELVC